MKKNKRFAKAEPEVNEGFVSRNIEEVESPSGGASRITVHVNEEGQIDWDKSKPGADEELLTAITNDPVMLEKIASHPDFQDTQDASVVTNDEAGMVLDVINMVEAMAFSSLSKKILGMKVDEKIVRENFTLTEDDHARQDPLAAQGLQQLVEFLQIDPRWKWAILLTTAHAASVGRNIKACVIQQYDKNDLTPPNPATQPPPEKVQ
jgi:hypothetical protein